jgi:hypothetical protein
VFAVSDHDGPDGGTNPNPNPNPNAAGDGDGRVGTDEGGPDDRSRAAARERMARAVRAVRIEGYKAAVIYAVADAALAAVLASVTVRVLGTTLPVPETVPLGPLSGLTASGTISGAALAALTAAAAVVCLETLIRSRRPLVDQFEAANPEVRERLRTARDAAASGAETRMAARLYEETLEALRSTSSYRLVDVRRLAVTVLLVTLIGLAGVQAAVVDLSVSPLPESADGSAVDDAPGSGPDAVRDTPEYGGLEDGSSVLGEEEDVETGDDPLNASVEYQTGGGEQAGSPPDSYDQSGFGDDDVESQRAGYADEQVPEDADLIREYALAVSEQDDDS